MFNCVIVPRFADFFFLPLEKKVHIQTQTTVRVVDDCGDEDNEDDE